MKENATVLQGAIWLHQSIYPSTKGGELPNYSAKSMEIYDLFDCSFLLQEVERKGGGIFLSSRLEATRVAYYSVTSLLQSHGKLSPPLQGLPPSLQVAVQWWTAPSSQDDLLNSFLRMKLGRIRINGIRPGCRRCLVRSPLFSAFTTNRTKVKKNFR